MSTDAPPSGKTPAGAFSVLKHRADFPHARRPRARPGADAGRFLLQARERAADEPAETPIRVG